MSAVTLERMLGLTALAGSVRAPRLLPWRSVVQCRRPPGPPPERCDHRPPISSQGDICGKPQEKKPCFDMSQVSFEMGFACHAEMIRSFLYSQFYPREPCNVSLWLPLDSPYLKIITQKYANSGDRFLAFEPQLRSSERRLIGVAVANKVRPWSADELEDWGHCWPPGPESNRLYFAAHCLRSPNLFQAHNIDYLYSVDVVATTPDVAGQGVATKLIRNALTHSMEAGYPLAQVIATSTYVAKICGRLGMRRSWTMEYADYVDTAGQRVFLPRRPHLSCSIYTRQFRS